MQESYDIALVPGNRAQAGSRLAARPARRWAAPQKAAVTASREPADGENLVDLAVLADRHRVPSWMEAALCRMMGWEAGKRVTDAAYKSALDKLKARRLGGGRAR